MRIGIAYSLKPADRGDEDGPDDRYEEFDTPETVQAIANVIRGEGHDVVLLGDGREFLGRILDEPPDFVWNMAEGQGIGRNREAHVPAVLEMLGIPYSGSDPLTLAAALDKDIAKRLVRAGGGTVPEGLSYPADGPALHDDSLGYPLILKPACEGSSKGVRNDTLYYDAGETLAACKWLHEVYQQTILIEQFIDGDEVTVGVIGNARGGHDVLGLMRIVPRRRDEPFVYSLEVKRDWANRVDYEAPARLPADVIERLVAASRAAFETLGCRDVARIDFRLRDGVPYFIEANPLPGLTPGVSDLVILAEGHGVNHAELIRRILHSALQRVGLNQPGAVAS